MRRFGILMITVILVGCSLATEASPATSITLTFASTLTSTTTPALPRTSIALPTSTSTPIETLATLPAPTLPPTATLPPTSTPAPTPLPPVTFGQEKAMTLAGQGMLSGLEDLPGYDIQVVLDVETLTLSGDQRVVYTNRHTAPLTEVYFNLYANARRFGGQMTVTDVTVNERPAELGYEKDDRVLRVSLPAPLFPGEQALIGMSFSLRVPRLSENRFRVLGYSKGILSLAGWYPMLAVLDSSGWHLDYPDELIGEAVFGESAFYTVQVTAPQTLVFATAGVQVDQVVHDDGRRTLFYHSGPIRTFYLSASQEYQVLSGRVGETIVRSYHLLEHEVCGQWVLESAIAALDLYSTLFGTYPFVEFDVVEADQWYQGMEWPGMMLLGSAFYDGTDPTCGEWFVAHEVAHQWWYNVVGNDPVAHPWLDEAFAQYTAMLYFRRLWPADAAEAFIQPIVYDRYARYTDRPRDTHIGQSTTAFGDREAYYAIIYARGAMFLEELHNTLGDDAFFAALQQYYQQNQFRVATPNALHSILRQATPDTVDRLWSEWVVGP